MSVLTPRSQKSNGQIVETNLWWKRYDDGGKSTTNGGGIVQLFGAFARRPLLSLLTPAVSKMAVRKDENNESRNGKIRPPWMVVLRP